MDLMLIALRSRGSWFPLIEREADGRAQRHMPRRQLVPAAQTCPHVPQFELLVCVLTHAPPQSVDPAGHVQAPLMQTPPVQVDPQAPQFDVLICRLTQVPLQLVVPAGQAHTPLTQLVPPPQVTPHPPQFSALVCVFTHVPLQ